MSTGPLPDGLAAILTVFAIAGVTIAIVGVWLTRLADEIADRTGIGEAMVGGLLLGATTSLGGTVTSISTAYQGFTDLAISNAIGGIAVQTAFLAVADIVYRRANLEHAAASIENLLQGTLLVALLALPLVAWSVPDPTLFGVSWFSPALLAFYIFANRLIADARERPMWYPRLTSDTQTEAPPPAPSPGRLGSLVWQFLVAAMIAAVAGYWLGTSGVALSAATGISQTAVGGIMTSVLTSVPELVVAIAAVRRGALNLAVGGIIGGNAFDVLFLVLSDIAYRDGSIYQAMGSAHVLALSASILMSAILLMGMLKRQRRGPGSIGFESALILVLYAGTAWGLATLG